MTLVEEAREFVKSLLGSSEVDGVIALKSEHGQISPALFKTAGEVDTLVLYPKYNLAKTVMRIQRQNPDSNLGELVLG
jgi:hypothetical protein